MSFYVYKYVKDNEIKYIGKTTNLDARIKQHTTDKLSHFNGDIYYFECANKTEMSSWEFMLIQKYHPKYNATFNDITKQVNCTEPEWKLYQNTMNTISNNIINLSQYIANKKTVKADPTTTTILKPTKSVEFRCRHCGAVFTTTKWSRTKGGHYSASCPCCPYTAWAK